MTMKPTQEQITRFCQHVANAHSWYKHLPLLTGAEFTIFLNPNAGKTYPSMHPKLPFGNHQSGYQQAFGQLDYIWKILTEPVIGHDSGNIEGIVSLLHDTEKTATITLYPYVANEIYWSIFEKEIEQLRKGLDHPDRQAILDAYNINEAFEKCWGELNDLDRETASKLYDISPANIPSMNISADLRNYLKLEQLSFDAHAKLVDSQHEKLLQTILKIIKD